MSSRCRYLPTLSCRTLPTSIISSKRLTASVPPHPNLSQYTEYTEYIVCLRQVVNRKVSSTRTELAHKDSTKILYKPANAPGLGLDPVSDMGPTHYIVVMCADLLLSRKSRAEPDHGLI